MIFIILLLKFSRKFLGTLKIILLYNEWCEEWETQLTVLCGHAATSNAILSSKYLLREVDNQYLAVKVGELHAGDNLILKSSSTLQDI